MTACTHGGAAMRLTPGTRCPYCTTIVPADATTTAGTRGAVSLEGTATREGSRPATIATGVAPHRERAGTVLLPCAPTTAPVATIADPAPATSTLCPPSAGGTHGANARPGAGSALNERREGHHAPKPCGLDADGALQGEPVQSAPSGDAAYMAASHGAYGPTGSPALNDGQGVNASSMAAKVGSLPPSCALPSLFAARMSDPDTAHEAAAAVSDVQRRNVYRAVLEALVEHGPSTDHDLARYVSGKLGHPIGQTSAGKRRGELRDAGFVCDSGHKGIVRETGAKAIRWALTPAGIDATGGVAL